MKWVVALAVVFMMSCDGLFRPSDPIVETWDFEPRWSWSGDKIAYTSRGIVDSMFARHVFIIDTTGENRRPVLGNAVMAVWLPGDSELVVMSLDFKLWRFNLNTQSLTRLCDCLDARFLEVDPSGQYLYYEDAGVANGWATSIYRMDLATGDTTHIIGGSFPNLSPDGRFLSYWRDNEVRVLELDSDSERVVFAPAFQAHLDWSPDGSDIVIGNITRRRYYGNLYKVHPDGSGARRFSTGISPQYSRTGNRLSVLRPGADNRYHLFLIDPDGGNPKQLTF